MKEKEYKLNIDPRILELLGPSLYTNIYYVLAELIANAYDADAHNVYIIANKDDITVEDDGKGMSYADGDIQKYLNVAAVSRNTDAESLTPMKRKKMGRKGVGKLAALSVSENVLIKTISNGEKSGFVLSRHINDNNLLVPLTDEQISFERVSGNLYMSKLSVDIFAQKIEYICDKLGYKKRTRQENKDHLSTLVKVTPR